MSCGFLYLARTALPGLTRFHAVARGRRLGGILSQVLAQPSNYFLAESAQSPGRSLECCVPLISLYCCYSRWPRSLRGRQWRRYPTLRARFPHSSPSLACEPVHSCGSPRQAEREWRAGSWVRPSGRSSSWTVTASVRFRSTYPIVSGHEAGRRSAGRYSAGSPDSPSCAFW